MRVRSVWSYMVSMSLLHSPRKLLKQHWVSEFPCHHILWTCEHVIPKSLIPEHNDLYNLILLPDRLNNIRSNFRYIQEGPHDHDPHIKVKTISPCSLRDCSCHHLQGKLVAKNLFIPPDPFKGMIGRSVLRMADRHPHHQELIQTKVLDLSMASLWDMSFPPSEREKAWHRFVDSYRQMA